MLTKINNSNFQSLSFKQTLIALTITCLLGNSCTQSGKVDQSEADTNLVLGLLVGQEQGRNGESSKDFILNGTWNAFTGNGTTSNTISTIKAKQGNDGIKLDDATTFTSCSIIKYFDNAEGVWIAQNPENNGGCFAGDTNKGKFFKIVFFKNTEKENSYWFCSLNFPGTDSLEAALAVSDNSDRSNPGTAGCSGFSWSRIDRR